MRTYYWYLTAYLRKHGVVIITSLVVAIGIFSLIIPWIVAQVGQKPRTYVGLVGEYTLDSLPPRILGQISEGLTTVQEDGTPTPNLAERWAVEDEGRTYRFILQKNFVWQDGSPLVPSEVTYSFQDVEKITTPTDVIFKLKDPFAPFPVAVSRPLTKTKDEPYLFFFKRKTVIGLGEYKVVGYQRKGEKLEQLVIENEDSTLIYRFYPTEPDALVAFKQGKVDLLPDFSSTYDVNDWPGIKVTTRIHNDRYLAVFFNNSVIAENIRQALSYAVPKPEDTTRAFSPISPDSWAFFPGVKAYDYDISRASERLLESLPPQPLNLQLITTVTFEKEAEMIKKAWEELGAQAQRDCQSKKEITDKAQCANAAITVTIVVNNFPDTSSFQALLIGQEVPADPDQYLLWHSGQSTNFTQYKNTRIDSLLEKGRQTVDKSERLATYQEFQQFFMEDAPLLILRHLESYTIERE
jgi:peptide/nickel transport system substrate-binding protein